MYKAMIKKSKNKKGFTLVELIVVMAILAILAAILIPSVGGMIRRSNRAVDNATARNLHMAATMAYSVDNTARNYVTNNTVASGTSQGEIAFRDFMGTSTTVPVKTNGAWSVTVSDTGVVTVSLGSFTWSSTSGSINWT